MPDEPPQIARVRQRWTTPDAIAKHLGCSSRTVRRWIREGLLPAYSGETRHYSDERTRLTTRRRFRLYEDDVTAFLERLRGGGRVATRKLWRRT